MALTPEQTRVRDYIESQGTSGCGFSYALLRSWGVPVPPKKGWKAELIRKGKIEVRQRDGTVKRIFPPTEPARMLAEITCECCGHIQTVDLRRYGATLPDGPAQKHAVSASRSRVPRRQRRGKGKGRAMDDRAAWAKIRGEEASMDAAYRRAVRI